jgi:hypothetical protein
MRRKRNAMKKDMDAVRLENQKLWTLSNAIIRERFSISCWSAVGVTLASFGSGATLEMRSAQRAAKFKTALLLISEEGLYIGR